MLSSKARRRFSYLTCALSFFLATLFSTIAMASDETAVDRWLEKTADAPIDGLTEGVYGRKDLDKLANYFPPGLLSLLDFDGFELNLAKSQSYKKHKSFVEATKKFLGQAQLAGEQQLTNYVAGQPFSTEQIKESTVETAGTMIAWNNVHRWHYYGYSVENGLAFIKPKAKSSTTKLPQGFEGGGDVYRNLTMFYHRVYLSGLSTENNNDYRLPVDGSDKYLFKEYIEMLSPYDVAGMKFVLERPIEQKEGDQVNSYLPTERRVRRLSAKERADSYIGTNWTFDDFEGWSGMVIDNDWKLVGKKVVPHVLNSENEVPRFFGPMSIIPRDRWQLRSCYVVEAVPKWDGHPYGRRLIFVDEENFLIPMTLVFNREGQLWKIFITTYQKDADVLEPTVMESIPRWRGSVAINLLDGSANVSPAIGPTNFPKVKASTVRKIFSISNLTGGR